MVHITDGEGKPWVGEDFIQDVGIALLLGRGAVGDLVPGVMV